MFATTTEPDAFVGEPVDAHRASSRPGDSDGFALTRLVIMHCVIDAQSASVPVAGAAGTDGLEDRASGSRSPEARSPAERRRTGARAGDVEPIDEPEDPYEY